MKERATLKQIAAELNVSVSTVSKALHNSSEISPETKQRIQSYAKLRNYRPNSIGVNLKSGRTRNIGLVIPDILNPFFAKVFSGIEAAAERKGYNVLTCITNESLEKEIKTVDLLSNGSIDGFIMAVSEGAQKAGEYGHLRSVMGRGLPIVMFDRVAEGLDCDMVIVDDRDAAINAVNYLKGMGRRDIALFSSIDNMSVGKLRAEGYAEAMGLEGSAVDGALVIKCESQGDFDSRAAGVFENNKIDGVFALDEHSTAFAHKMALKAGFRIPEDIAIIGFADGLWSRRLTPSLSTLSQHGPEIGEAAAELLIERLEGDGDRAFVTRVIKTQLRHRDSTGGAIVKRVG